MTPNELLESVKPRFTPLLHDETDKLQALLVKALRAYQDRAGYVAHVRVKKEDGFSVALPADYLELVNVNDATGDWVDADVINNKIEIANTWGLRWPLTVEYLVHLAALDLEKDTVPPTLVGIIQDYLEALIAIPNTNRIRRVSIASKVDVSDLPDENTLNERKKELEVDMNARGAIPRGAVIYSAIGKGW